VTGIERVMVETNKNLLKFLDPLIYELHPFTTVPGLERHAHLHPYLLSDPILSKPLIEFDDCDVLFFGGINLNIPIKDFLNLKQNKKLKIITIVHDILPFTHPEWIPDPVASTGRRIKLTTKTSFHIYFQAMFALSDQIILVSKHVNDEISRLGWSLKPKIAVVPLGAFDPQIPVSESSAVGTNTLYISRIAPHKGHEELLAAFDLLWNKGIDITLTLIGSNGWDVDKFIKK
jgi:glycosyltransferase involved in cell wall biosynthesis